MKQMMTVAIVAMGFVALLATGCGGGSDDNGTDPNTDTNTPTPDTTNPTPDTTDPTPDTTDPTPDTTLPPPIDTGAPPSSVTCQDVIKCAMTCLDAGCIANCQADASVEVQTQFTNTLQCQQQCVVDPQAGTVDLKCMSEACFDDAHACMGKPNTDLACGDIFLCIQGCPQTAQGCPAECLLSAADKGTFDAFLAIGTCFDEACPLKPGETAENLSEETNACLEAAQAAGGACSDTITACIGPMPGGKPGMSFISPVMMRWIFDLQFWMHPVF